MQHRETQGHESGSFKALFKDGVTYREGGIAGGFRSTSKKDDFDKRLLHVKGRRSISVTQVPCEAASVNSGDCFILDDFENIYQWNGPKASRLERQKVPTPLSKRDAFARSTSANRRPPRHPLVCAHFGRP